MHLHFCKLSRLFSVGSGFVLPQPSEELLPNLDNRVIVVRTKHTLPVKVKDLEDKLLRKGLQNANHIQSSFGGKCRIYVNRRRDVSS